MASTRPLAMRLDPSRQVAARRGVEAQPDVHAERNHRPHSCLRRGPTAKCASARYSA